MFCDSSFGNNDDSRTQLGFIVLMIMEKSRKANCLYFASYKRKRLVHSVLGGETYAFSDGFYYAFLMRHDMEKLLGQKLPLTILTD